MRKILLATTALVGFAVAGAAQAATSPINVTVGGSVDFLAGAYHESKAAVGQNGTDRDFETLYSLNFGITGKANNGVEYGGVLSLDNTPDISNGFDGEVTGLNVSAANVYMSGAFGKVVLGDSRGVTDLALTAPTVGTGGVYGRYIDFLGTDSFAKVFVAGVDATEHSTNVSYYTPKVGNETHKVQAGLTYAPNMYDNGSSVVHVKSRSAIANDSAYGDVVKGVVAYTGAFKDVTVGVTADVVTGGASKTNTSSAWMGSNTGVVRDFTSYGVGVQAAAHGFTAGINYLDLGHYNASATQTKDQHQVGAGLKYEFSKVAVGAGYLGGKSYSNVNGQGYVDFDSYSLGGNYSWAPGLTTNVDGVLFSQKNDAGVKNDGYVLLVSQKLAF